MFEMSLVATLKTGKKPNVEILGIVSFVHSPHAISFLPLSKATWTQRPLDILSCF